MLKRITRRQVSLVPSEIGTRFETTNCSAVRDARRAFTVTHPRSNACGQDVEEKFDSDHIIIMHEDQQEIPSAKKSRSALALLQQLGSRIGFCVCKGKKGPALVEVARMLYTTLKSVFCTEGLKALLNESHIVCAFRPIKHIDPDDDIEEEPDLLLNNSVRWMQLGLMIYKPLDVIMLEIGNPRRHPWYNTIELKYDQVRAPLPQTAYLFFRDVDLENFGWG